MSVRWLCVAIAAALETITCAESTPTGPTTPAQPPLPAEPPPPSVNNTPPTITEVRTSSMRVEADQEVEVTGFVKDEDRKSTRLNSSH